MTDIQTLEAQSMAFRTLCTSHRAFLCAKRLLEKGGTSCSSEIRLAANYAEKTETDARRLLSKVACHVSTREHVISSLSAPLALEITEATPGTTHLGMEVWGEILRALSVDEFDILVSRGLGVGFNLLSIFKLLDILSKGDATRARGFADIIARRIGPVYRFQTQSGYSFWLHDDFPDVRTPLLAPWMIAQTRAFPADSAGAIRRAVKTGNVDTLLQLHLAGAPVQDFRAFTYEGSEIDILIVKMSSHHGKVEIAARTGDLAHYLAQDPIVSWSA